MSIPVAVFTYNRPQHLEKVLECIKINSVKNLYLFSDGWKSEDDKISVLAVRRIIENIDWCDKKVVYRDKNLGLGKSIREGINYVFKDNNKIIVIEDDILIRPNAFKLVCDALLNFENDNDIMTVSMWNHKIISNYEYPKGFFSERFVCWGWGTYKWAWELYNESPIDIYKKCLEKGIDLAKWGNDIEWQAINSEKKNLWYVGFMLTHLYNNKYSYFFPETLSVNIGRDGSGENTGNGYSDDMILLNKSVNRISAFPEIDIVEDVSFGFRKYFDIKKVSLLQNARNYFGIITRKIGLK